MGSYTWDNFTSEKFYDELVAFFQAILKKGQWDCVVFVSRKAYCLFLLLKQKGIINSDECVVFSDRYVMKSMKPDLFKGQKVCLVDDTLSTGQHMNEVYKLIKRKAHKTAKIYPKVFAGGIRRESVCEQKEFALECGVSINIQLQWSSSEILRFSVIENLIMFQEGIPYAMELPTITNGIDGSIVLSEEEYGRLKKLSYGWQFYECNQAGYMQNNMTYGVLIMRNNSIAEFLSNFVFKFCVRLQITKVEDDFHIVAMPFAILKSVKFDELYELFETIYGDTNYGCEVKKYLENGHSEEEVYIAIYRAIVFNLSSYIGDAFIDALNLYVLEDSVADFSSKNQKYHFDEEFCKITENMIDRAYIEYIDKLIRHPEFTGIKSNENDYLYDYAKRFQGLTCDYRTMILYILLLINEVRYFGLKSSLPKPLLSESVKFITIEDLQRVLYSTYFFEDKEQIDDLLTICICIMLGQGMISNEICYDSTGTVYRGFKYGTNSEALLELSAKIFYVALNKYYDVCMVNEFFDDCFDGDSIYTRNFEKFMSVLRLFLSDYQLIGSVITIDELKLYQEFFREKERETLKTIVKNKLFIGDDVKQPYYLEKLKELIELSDIYS